MPLLSPTSFCLLLWSEMDKTVWGLLCFAVVLFLKFLCEHGREMNNSLVWILKIRIVKRFGGRCHPQENREKVDTKLVLYLLDCTPMHWWEIENNNFSLFTTAVFLLLLYFTNKHQTVLTNVSIFLTLVLAKFPIPLIPPNTLLFMATEAHQPFYCF